MKELKETKTDDIGSINLDEVDLSEIKNEKLRNLLTKLKKQGGPEMLAKDYTKLVHEESVIIQ